MHADSQISGPRHFHFPLSRLLNTKQHWQPWQRQASRAIATRTGLIAQEAHSSKHPLGHLTAVNSDRRCLPIGTDVIDFAPNVEPCEVLIVIVPQIGTTLQHRVHTCAVWCGEGTYGGACLRSCSGVSVVPLGASSVSSLTHSNLCDRCDIAFRAESGGVDGWAAVEAVRLQSAKRLASATWQRHQVRHLVPSSQAT